ncbi:DUF5691 domain-containing protein [Paraflavitalea sp. CAU 1676]|uniref:DUF5691 domain-containing protein n=1 Tax=Paraflavitalea sp. CAU 1676 TaxID=3032598 RepID=UPI0023DA0D33|nr:DUF5691 domain-containing protein [Paraflavitalea sp. CAU 1676]MDF2191199.1 DUF5691 domain-containing protein [Paraflavitalea sp. CAU 1676]
MEMWQEMLNAAMMGTDKRPPGVESLTPDLQEAVSLIVQQTDADREEQFLRIASLAFNYRQCGVSPMKNAAQEGLVAGEEDKAYCTPQALQVLKDIIEEDNVALLQRWLQECVDREQLIHPELLPAMLSQGKQHKKLQTLLGHCCGKRGAWLGRFNPEWNFSIEVADTEVWQTGSLEQRKAALQDMRNTDPALGREWLQKTWPQEDANTKTELLAMLVTNIGAEDAPFLEGLAGEKSKKVKEQAVSLLRRIPSSSVVQLYEQVLRQSISYKKEKVLPGLSSKHLLDIQLPSTIDEQVFKSGIEKLSDKKGVSDEDFIVYQLAACVPPSIWEQLLGGSPEEVIAVLKKDVKGKYLIASIAQAIVQFNDRTWALAFVKHVDTNYIELFPLLPANEQDAYAINALSHSADRAIILCAERPGEWSIDLTRQIFRYAARHPYQYNRSFYSQHIERFPFAILFELDGLTPPEEHFKPMWSNISTYLHKLIGLKQQLFQSFNAIK